MRAYRLKLKHGWVMNIEKAKESDQVDTLSETESDIDLTRFLEMKLAVQKSCETNNTFCNVEGLGDIRIEELTLRFIDEADNVVEYLKNEVEDLKIELASLNDDRVECDECEISDTAFNYINKQVREINCLLAEKVNISGLGFKFNELKDCISRIESTLKDHET